MEEIYKCNGPAHVPTCDTWPPTWLISPPIAPSTPPLSPPVATVSEPTAPPPDTSPPPRRPHGYTPDAIIVVADEQAYTDRAMRGPPYMWTWIGAETWHYVADFPIPERGKK